MKFTFLMVLLLSTYSALATVSAGKIDCPSQFEGKVKKIIEAVGADNPLSTQKVIFENQHTIKGNVGDQVLLDVLKHGPFEIEQGKEYRVQLNQGKLCWIEKLDSEI